MKVKVTVPWSRIFFKDLVTARVVFAAGRLAVATSLGVRFKVVFVKT